MNAERRTAEQTQWKMISATMPKPKPRHPRQPRRPRRPRRPQETHSPYATFPSISSISTLFFLTVPLLLLTTLPTLPTLPTFLFIPTLPTLLLLPTLPTLPLPTFLTLLPTCQAQLLPDQPSSNDYYCGVNWNEANRYCEMPCPSGSPAECPGENDESGGRSRKCFASAGCFGRMQRLCTTLVVRLDFHHNNANNDMGGSGSGIGIMSIMSKEQTASFETTLKAFLGAALQEEKIEVTTVMVQDQEVDRPCVSAAIDKIDNMNGIYDLDNMQSPQSPQSATSLDTSPDTTSYTSLDTSLDSTLFLCGQYVPIGTRTYTEDAFELLLLEKINSNSQLIANALNSDAGWGEGNDPTGAGEVVGVAEEVEVVAVTALSPATLPSAPSSSPSDPPSRSNEQILETYIESNPTGSFGIIFIVKTREAEGVEGVGGGVPTVLLTGLSFVTSHEGEVEYELYTKLGGYRSLHGRLRLFDLIASGKTMGMGAKEFTPLLTTHQINTLTDSNGISLASQGYVGFTPVHIPGNGGNGGQGGQRTLYLTLTPVPIPPDLPVGATLPPQPPILFSYGKNGRNEGKYLYEEVVGNEELVVMEGDGVLDYPMPKEADGGKYRRPRGFIGRLEYDRAPCYPNVDFTGWPCPLVTNTRDPTKMPAGTPTLPSAEISAGVSGDAGEAVEGGDEGNGGVSGMESPEGFLSDGSSTSGSENFEPSGGVDTVETAEGSSDPSDPSDPAAGSVDPTSNETPSGKIDESLEIGVNGAQNSGIGMGHFGHWDVCCNCFPIFPIVVASLLLLIC